MMAEEVGEVTAVEQGSNERGHDRVSHPQPDG